MSDLTLREFLANKDSLFNSITNSNLFPFLESVETDLDLMLEANYGDRLLYSAFKDFTVNELASIITTNFKIIWNNYNELIQIDINMGQLVETTERATNDQNNIIAGNRTNSLAVMNSTDLVDESGESENREENLNGELNKTITTNTIDFNSNDELLWLRAKKSLYNQICNDVANYLTLSIY